MKTKVKRYETNYLLALSRFPEHFYGLINPELVGREVIYNNPGISLRSFVLSGRNPLSEFLDVSGRMLDIIEECEDFCHNMDVIKEVNSALMKQPYDIVENILMISADDKMIEVQLMMKRLNVLNSALNDSWEALKSTAVNDQIDLFTREGSNYKQALFDLKDYARELVDALEQLQGVGS